MKDSVRLWRQEDCFASACRNIGGSQQIEQTAVGNHITTTWNFENQPTLYRLPSGGGVTLLFNTDNRRVEKQEP